MSEKRKGIADVVYLIFIKYTYCCIVKSADTYRKDFPFMYFFDKPFLKDK